MSNPIRYDSLLVRALAAELDERLGRRRATALFLDSASRTLRLDLPDETLLWELHPTRGRIALLPRAESRPKQGPAAEGEGIPLEVGEVRLPRKAVIRGAVAPPDERVVHLRVSGGGAARGRARSVIVELLTNRWNALAVDGEGRILAALVARGAGGRTLRGGRAYEPPSSTRREGAEEPVGADRWRQLLAGTEPAARVPKLVSAVAYTSPLNAAPILGAAAVSDAPDALDEAHARYLGVVAAGAPGPQVLELEGGLQPYPVPLPGITGRPASSLLDAITAAAGAEVAPAPEVPPALLKRLGHRLGRLERRIARLREELSGAGPEAAALRRQADLLLSQVHLVAKGSDRVALSDFAGGTVTLTLDPALTPAANAERLYDAARRRERAAHRLPPLLTAAERELDALATLRRRAERGEADVAEVEAAVGQPARAPGRREGLTRPYRQYRTSGGLEVRVGRGRRQNDDLTFRHAAPDDIWLHARDAAGAHVILRWPDREANPPARDLREAAVLAALHSRSRTSGTVAVDWTRRKYVRKPRKAPPGVVTPDRVHTLFVEPDETVQSRMAADGGDRTPGT